MLDGSRMNRTLQIYFVDKKKKNQKVEMKPYFMSDFSLIKFSSVDNYREFIVMAKNFMQKVNFYSQNNKLRLNINVQGKRWS